MSEPALGPVTTLLSDPARWTQNTNARTAAGKPTNDSDPAAVCWCLFGALNRCYRNPEYNTKLIALMDAVVVRRYLSIADFNDHVTHEEVLELCKLLNL